MTPSDQNITPHRSSFRSKLLQRIAITAGLLLVIAVSYFGVQYIYAVDLGTKEVTIIIESGDSFHDVGEKLLAEGVVSSRLMLFLPAKWRGIDKKLVPGRYDFTGTNSCRSVLDRLEAGDFLVVKVTVFEGATIWKVASILQSELELDSATVVALNSDSAFLEEVSLPYLEGYLFPETYFFPWGTGSKTILKDMVAMYRKQTEGIWPSEIPNQLTRREAIVLASIVEAEAFFNDEMPRIASVYHNRLRKSWRLDADPTVIYGLGGLDRPLNKGDLRKNTPYNTYRRKGLPPTPINSPGLAAIKAALQPDSTDYFFFVADGTGYHRFSKTNTEHNRARYEIRQNINRPAN